MTLPERERTFIEKLGGLIPGYSSYAEKNRIREDDRIFRYGLAGGIDGAVTDLRRFAGEHATDLGLMDPIAGLEGAMTLLADKMRYAEDGGTGIFDETRIGAEELDEIRRYDERIGEAVMAALDEFKKALAGEPDGDSLNSIRRRFEEAVMRFDERRGFISEGCQCRD